MVRHDLGHVCGARHGERRRSRRIVRDALNTLDQQDGHFSFGRGSGVDGTGRPTGAGHTSSMDRAASADNPALPASIHRGS